MRELPAALEAHLATGTTTLCWCWRLTRKDGVIMGFTDHDRDLTFDGTTFEAAAGFTASEMTTSLGLSVDDLEVSSALSSNRLEEADLATGAYDDARVEIFRVNWNDTGMRALMRTGSIGEVRRAGHIFAAEVRGLTHYLQQPRGRVFQFGCDADVGDSHCGIDLGQAAFRGVGTVQAMLGERGFTAVGLDSFASDWFTRGLLTFTSGAAVNQAVEVKRHSMSQGVVTLEIWQGVRGPIGPGQTFVVTAGCDKLLATCRDKFANAVNHRGFPHMPGNDFVTRYIRKAGT
ncbi:MAG: DUF2163 domain-containing protein [Hyphomicrobiaceae bacterium]